MTSWKKHFKSNIKLSERLLKSLKMIIMIINHLQFYSRCNSIKVNTKYSGTPHTELAIIRNTKILDSHSGRLSHRPSLIKRG